MKFACDIICLRKLYILYVCLDMIQFAQLIYNFNHSYEKFQLRLFTKFSVFTFQGKFPKNNQTFFFFFSFATLNLTNPVLIRILFYLVYQAVGIKTWHSNTCIVSMIGATHSIVTKKTAHAMHQNQQANVFVAQHHA